jgi:outer membrane receptor protein involved in Fe transport
MAGDRRSEKSIRVRSDGVRVLLLVTATSLAAVVARADDTPPPAQSTVSEHVTVTATRIPEDAAEVPASFSVAA